DVVSPRAVSRVYDAYPDITLVNGYGPTENTTFTACCKIARGTEYTSIPIGLPVSGTSLYVLSPEMTLTPPGYTGELFSGGAGLALGYLDQPALTAERFVRNPFGDGVLYRTGDLVRVGEDGNLLFMGRTDNQVKIRGFRVELGEIVHQIDSLAGVQSSLVQVTGEEAADKQLVAWVVAQQGTELDVETLKAALAERVPAHMVPTYLVLLAEWPLTSVGKIDRRALPAPDKVSQQAVYVAPQGAQEAALVDIWAELLKIEPAQLGVNTNFFSVGGHSLLAVQMLAMIKDRFDITITLGAFWQHQTIREMANLMSPSQQSATNDSDSLLVRLSVGNGKHPTVFCVPGVGGNANEFSALAEALNDYQVYAVQPRGLDGQQADNSIYTMAEDYVAAMMATKETDQLIIVGHSMGATIVIEMLLILRRLGVQPHQILLLDASAPETGDRRTESQILADAYQFLAMRLVQLKLVPTQSLNQIAQSEQDKLVTLAQTDSLAAVDWLLTELTGQSPTEEQISVAHALLQVYESHLQAFAQYRADPETALLRCQFKFVAASHRKAEHTQELLQGWQQVLGAENLALAKAEGTHFTMLKGQGARDISGTIKNET
ncbi:alpha/beta fold hydrolase, partial [Pseudoalteromonas ardens]